MSLPQRRLVALSAALLLALIGGSPALAHASLVSSDPEDRAVVASPPTVVTLRFSEGLDADKSSFRLAGPDGDVGTGRLTKDGGHLQCFVDGAFAHAAFDRDAAAYPIPDHGKFGFRLIGANVAADVRAFRVYRIAAQPALWQPWG